MKTLLWLDDYRNPFLDQKEKIPGGKWDIQWVRNYEEFRQWIFMYGLPDAISFDHDLADEHYTPEFFWKDYDLSKKYQDFNYKNYKEKTGRECAKLLVSYCNMSKDEPLPKWYIHSDNPVGRDAIKKILVNYEKSTK